jgi:hypothetical protein
MSLPFSKTIPQVTIKKEIIKNIGFFFVVAY